MASHEPSAAAAVRHFSDPDDFGDALLGGQFDYLPMPGQVFSATLRLLRVDDLVVQRSDTSAHIVRGAIEAGLAALIVPLRHPAKPARMNGDTAAGAQAFLAPGGVEFHGHCPSATAWAAVSLPLPQLAALAELAPQQLGKLGDASLLSLPQAAAARLAGTLDQAARMAHELPSELALPGRATGLATALREAVADTLTADARLLSRPRAGREAQRVVRLAEEFMRTQIGQPIYREQLCTSLGVSLRKLHDAFVTVCGVSPQTYLKIRRLSLARQALRGASVRPSLVKSVALAHGFWHLGYFSRDYRALFGEPPSHTVKLAAGGAFAEAGPYRA